MHLNYGMQAWYRDHGIEPCCGICVHFEGTPVDVEAGIRVCGRPDSKRERLVTAADVCYAPERAPGADPPEA